MTKNDVLREIFGYTSFRKGQEEIIDKILNGKDVMAIMPTGGGKSICYQIPSLMFEGTALVISPLISLMHDQVMGLVQMGVKAAYLNSSLSENQYRQALARAYRREFKIIYVAPERLETESFVKLAEYLDISFVCVDEAHCISQWGHDFRPSYTKIPNFLEKLPKRPVVAAFTATATQRVKEDIKEKLTLKDPYVHTSSFDRENLFFEVKRSYDSEAVLMNLVSQIGNESTIIYCITRKDVDMLEYMLRIKNLSVTKYHAGLEIDERKQNQEDFIFGRKNIMVATNAFGMGIDKPDIRYIIHYGMPKNMESYYQEVGRAGRDGLESKCILLYNDRDMHINKFLIENGISEELSAKERELVKKEEMNKLRTMRNYVFCEDCLRSYILSYFGEHHSGNCGKCSSCIAQREFVDGSAYAKVAVACIADTGERFSSKNIISVLKGEHTDFTDTWHLSDSQYFGALSDLPKDTVSEILDKLVIHAYATVDTKNYNALKLNAHAFQIGRQEQKILIKPFVKKEKRANRSETVYTIYLNHYDPSLMEKLKNVRAELAKKYGVPAFMIFNDATLREMVIKRPKTVEQMKDISGVGSAKLKKYGDVFLETIKNY